MLEIEAKIKVDTLDAVAQRLGEIGATFVGKHIQRDEYFRDADNKLSDSGCGLRLRTETANGQTRFILTFKGPRKDGPYKIRPEHETTVGDPTAAAQILAGLGCQVALTLTKTRQLWTLDGCQVCLDTVLPLGFFVEVEGGSEAAVGGVLTRLGLADAPHITEGYAEMLAKPRQD